MEDLSIEAVKIKYRLAVYETPSGEIIRGRLPFNLNGKHFGPDLIAFCLDQYQGRCVTRPQLLEQLHGFGVEISSGELDNLLIVDKDVFHEEKVAVFEAGIAHSNHLNTDDTGARHDGKNGVCTHIGSPLFCYFESTSSKSRANFLGILRGRHTDYILSEDAPNQVLRQQIEEDFDGLFTCKTESEAINNLLKNTFSRRAGLLRVLDCPELPLHNNDSERDIREYVKKRKISGSTRSVLGRKARDTFASLKKTCQKLGISFWDYLRDRAGRIGQIKPLADLIAEKAATTPA